MWRVCIRCLAPAKVSRSTPASVRHTIDLHGGGHVPCPQRGHLTCPATTVKAEGVSLSTTLLTAAAFVLFQALRAGLAGTELGRATVATLRLKLLKIGATVKESWRRVVIALPMSYPWKHLWRRAAIAADAH